MKIAYASDWLTNLFASNATLQRGCAADWMSVATITTLIASNAHLSALADLPAIQVAYLTLGTVTLIVIRLGVAELTVHPIDRRGFIVTKLPADDLADITRLLVTGVTVRGKAITESMTA